MKPVLFLSFLFTGLMLGPAAAHALELPHKIVMSAQESLTVQKIYSGWALLGIEVFGALISNLVLTILTRGQGMAFRLALLAFLPPTGRSCGSAGNIPTPRVRCWTWVRFSRWSCWRLAALSETCEFHQFFDPSGANSVVG